MTRVLSDAWGSVKSLSPRQRDTLGQQGYRLLAEAGGYRLLDGPGLITKSRLEEAAEEWPSALWTWHAFDTVDTTMAVARRLWLETESPVAVVADTQTAGRGRRGRSWTSPPGAGLHLSLAASVPSEWLSGPLTLVTGLAAQAAVRRVTGISLGLKWPNDGLWEGQKCFGVLVDAQPGLSSWVILGIGINVNGQGHCVWPGAVTLEEAAGRPWNRSVLAAAVAQDVERAFETWACEGTPSFLQQWREVNVTLGRPVSIHQQDTVWYGYAEDILPSGALQVRKPDGTLLTVTAGEVSLRTLEGTGGGLS